MEKKKQIMLTPIRKFGILNLFTGKGIFYVKNTMALVGGEYAKALFCEHIDGCHSLLGVNMNNGFKKGNVWGRLNKGKKMSKEVREQMSKDRKGRPAWNKGKKMSEEFCRRLSEVQQGGVRGGDKSCNWKGDDASYSAFHYRVSLKRGKPNHCEICNTTDNRTYHWANLTGNYADVMDYKRMCVPCHKKYDYKREELLCKI